jgi:hypothetical protein
LWREGRHDNLVLAVAAWLGEQALTAPDEPVFERIIVA